MLPAYYSDKHTALPSCQANFKDFLRKEYQVTVKDYVKGLGIRCLCFDTAENTLLLSNIISRHVHLIHLRNGKFRLHNHHEATVRHITRFGNEIVTSSWDGSVRVVDFHSLAERLMLTNWDMGRSPYVSVTPDGRYVFSFSYDVEKNLSCNTNIVRQWSYSGGELIQIFSNTGIYKSTIRSGLCIPYGDLLYIISNSGILSLFDLPSGHLIHQTSIRGDFRFMCLVPEFNLIAATDTRGSVYLYNIKTNRIFASWKIHQDDITCIKKHPTRPELIVTCSFDGYAKIWQVPDFRCIKVLPIDNYELWTCEFIKDLLVVGSTSGYLFIFDISDLSSIHLKGRMFLSKNSFALFPENSPLFYTNDITMVDISRTTDGSFITGKEADYLISLFHSRKALDMVFGEPAIGNESTSLQSKLIRQIPASFSRSEESLRVIP